MDKQYGLQIAAQIAEQDYLRFDRSISTQPGVLHDFREALLEKGFQFRYLHETLQYMPKEKDIIVPLVLQYFQYATEIEDKKTLLPWLYYNGLYQAVPVLIHEFETCSAEGRLLYGWELGDTLYKIRCKQYTKEYMEIIQKKEYGISRQMVVMLLGTIKCYESAPILFSLLPDEDITLHVLTALGQVGRLEYIPALETYTHSSNSARRKGAKLAIERIIKRSAITK